MVDLVNDLDEITRLESGEQPMHKENFVVQDLIGRCMKHFRKKRLKKI